MEVNLPTSRKDFNNIRAKEGLEPATFNYSDPTPTMLEDIMWNAIWDEIKTWDINVPTEYNGYCGATGNHVTAIYLAIKNAFVNHKEINKRLTKLLK